MRADGPGPSCTITREAGRLTVRCRRQRQLPAAAFLAFWLCGWYLGETWAVGFLHRLVLGAEPAKEGAVPAAIFVTIWLLVWTAGGAGAFVALLGSLGGQDVFLVEGRTLLLRQSLGPIRWTRAYELEGVTSLRAVPASEVPPARLSGRRRAPQGRLAFEYRGRTVRFGASLSDDDVGAVLGALASRVPSTPRCGLGGLGPVSS